VKYVHTLSNIQRPRSPRLPVPATLRMRIPLDKRTIGLLSELKPVHCNRVEPTTCCYLKDAKRSSFQTASFVSEPPIEATTATYNDKFRDHPKVSMFSACSKFIFDLKSYLDGGQLHVNTRVHSQVLRSGTDDN
jgi:hypothetical protein